jgi:hypothetical protein
VEEQTIVNGEYSEEATDQTSQSMTEEELKGILAGMIVDAETFVQDQIKPLREEAQKRYDGQLYGDEVDGRSKVVSRDVRDSVAGLMPPLMRIFFGAEKVVEYVPSKPEDVAGAEQATDYINHVITKDNCGFEEFYAAFKDALVLKTGIIKWWWDKDEVVDATPFSGIDQASLEALMGQEGIEVADIQAVEDPNAPPADQMGNPLPPQYLYEGTIKRRRDRSIARIRAVPPEELLIDPRATSFDDAEIVVHSSMPTVSELVAMGYPEDEVMEQASSSSVINEERLIRNGDIVDLDSTNNPQLRRVRYDECYARIDFDGDGIAELRRICCIGEGHDVVHNEPWDEVPFASFCPDPRSHQFFGNSIADITIDIQRVKTVVMREMLNSLAQSVNPRMGVVEGQVNLEDALNNENGGIIRMRAPGMVMPYETPFVGQAAFPVLDYMDAVKEQRTGRSRASQGLAADVLQSTTKSAVDATVTAAQESTELIARIFAETGMKRLFKGLLRLIIKHQDRARMVRLRNQWVNVDPRAWDAEMDVTVNVALGGGTSEERGAKLQAIAEKQEQILLQVGPQNPIVSLKQYAATLKKMVELAGFPDSSQFFNDVPDNWQPPPGAQKPAPEEMLAQAQIQAIQADMQKKAAELQLKQQEMLMDNDRQRDQMAQDREIRLAELQLKYQADLQKTDMKIQAEQMAPREVAQ